MTLESSLPAPQINEPPPVAIRSVHHDVKLNKPVPPPKAKPPEPKKIAPQKIEQRKPAAVKPPPRRRKRRKKQVRKAKTAPQQAVKPAVAQIPMNLGPATGQGVEVQDTPVADEGGTDEVVDPRAGHVDGEKDGVGVDLSGYGARVRAAVQRRQHYPESAEEDGVEGTVRVRVTVRADGSLVAKPTIIKSSGNGTLDREALRMVRASAPFANLPSGFKKDGTAQLTIPIIFELEEDDF